MLKPLLISLAFMMLCAQGAAFAASGGAERSGQARKPLQRCDQLSDKAQLDCLEKARERVVDARRKRESAGKGDDKVLAPQPGAAPAGGAGEKPTPKK